MNRPGQLGSTSSTAGFTVVELMVTITIASILVAIAVPSFRDMTRNQRRVSVVNDLVFALNYARSEAVKQDRAAGVAVIAAAGGWQNGYRVCCTAANTDLTVIGPLNADVVFTANVGGNAPAELRFGNSGAQLVPLGTYVFTFCDARGAAQGMAVEVTTQGRVASSGRPGYRVDQSTALVCGS